MRKRDFRFIGQTDGRVYKLYYISEFNDGRKVHIISNSKYK